MALNVQYFTLKPSQDFNESLQLMRNSKLNTTESYAVLNPNTCKAFSAMALAELSDFGYQKHFSGFL